jgi:hypothetical protein
MHQRDVSSISEDLVRVVERIESPRGLDAELCERLTRSIALLWARAADDCSEVDRASFDRILVAITPSASVDTRLFLSDRLSTAAEPPHGILLILARDDVEVARPVLENSTALTEDELIEVARTRGHTHMEVIAERRELTVRVTDVLVLRGDDAVRRIVAGNGGARLSDKSFSRLSLQAGSDQIVACRLIRRDDLPDLVVRVLVEQGWEEARVELARRESQKTDLGRVTAVAPSIRATEDGWLDPYDFNGASSVLNRLGEVKHHLDAFVRKLAETERFPEIVHIVAAVAGLPLDTMKHVMVSLDTEPFVVVAKAVGLSSETLGELLSTGPWLHRLDGRSRNKAIAAFRAVTQEDARRRLAEWSGHGAQTERPATE